jgi:hypothetical protein
LHEYLGDGYWHHGRLREGEFDMENIEDPEKLETYVRFVYEALLNLHGEGVQVGHKTMVRGRSGSWYENRDAVLALHGKLADIGNINGVMVSRAGFQRGTRELAAHAGIDIRTLKELPSFRDTLAMRVA